MKSLAGSLISRFIDDIWRNELKLKQATDPCLIIHGKKDRIIPFSHSESLYKAVGSKHKNLLLIEQATHNDFDHLQDIIQPVGRFLRKFARRRLSRSSSSGARLHALSPESPKHWIHRKNHGVETNIHTPSTENFPQEPQGQNDTCKLPLSSAPCCLPSNVGARIYPQDATSIGSNHYGNTEELQKNVNENYTKLHFQEGFFMLSKRTHIFNTDWRIWNDRK